MDYNFVNPHPNPNFVHSTHMVPSSPHFILSDYLRLDDIFIDQESHSQSIESLYKVTFSHANQGSNHATSKNNNM